jgi:DNA-nicking Smr family endonuclease
MSGDESESFPEDWVKLEIDGVLDLHPFQPKETISVVEEYIRCCVEKEIPIIRIIHGKGIGVQRDRVHAFLKTSPHVISYGLDSGGSSSWGATIAKLRILSGK